MREFILKQRLARGISYKLENDVACPSLSRVHNFPKKTRKIWSKKKLGKPRRILEWEADTLLWHPTNPWATWDFPPRFPQLFLRFRPVGARRLHLAAYPWLSILVAPFAFRFSRFHSALLLTFLLGNCGWKGYFSSRGIFSAECRI